MFLDHFRDLKSSNVLLTKEGRAKIADVGLAKLLGDEDMSTITAAGIAAPSHPRPHHYRRSMCTLYICVPLCS